MIIIYAEGASPSQYMATNVTAHVTLDRNHMPPPPPPAIQTRPHAVTGPAAATEVQTEPLLANEPADREGRESIKIFSIDHHIYQELMSRPKGGRSVQLRGTAFESERSRH